MPRVTVDVEDVGSVFHCTFVDSESVECTEIWQTRETRKTSDWECGIIVVY